MTKPSIKNLLTRLKTIRLPEGKAQGQLFEDLCEEKIQEEGFVKSNIVLTVEEKEMFKNHEIIQRLNIGEYISQPTGNNNRPDFIIRDKQYQKGLECKSVIGLTPMYNSGYPSKNTIYAIATSRQIEDPITILDGGQIVSDKLKKLIEDYTKESKERDAYWNERAMSLGDDNPFGIGFYSRVQAQHRGQQVTTSYFTERAAMMEGIFFNSLEDDE